MDPLAFVAAAFAPLVAWLLWRVQALGVDRVLRPAMYRLLRYQRRTYAVVSWTGVLLHELSHAFFLLLGGHGIRNFQVKVDSGHVTPHQVRKGPIGLLTFLIAALAPLFVAPALILGLAWLLLDSALLHAPAAGTGLTPAWDVLRDTATRHVGRFARVLLGLDVTTWAGGAVLALAVFALPSARPSHVKGSRGEKDEGDIAVVRAKVRRRPLPLLAVLLVLYASYFALVPWRPTWYWGFWTTVWAVALTGTLLALLGGVAWVAVAWTGRTRAWAAWIPYAAGLVPQVLGRTHTDAPVWLLNATSLAVFGLLALGLSLLAPRRW